MTFLDYLPHYLLNNHTTASEKTNILKRQTFFIQTCLPLWFFTIFAIPLKQFAL